MLRAPEGGRVLDLGCGTGELTAELHRGLGARETLGVDRAESMLERTPEADGLRFVRADIADVAAQKLEGLGKASVDVV